MLKRCVSDPMMTQQFFVDGAGGLSTLSVCLACEGHILWLATKRSGRRGREGGGIWRRGTCCGSRHDTTLLGGTAAGGRASGRPHCSLRVPMPCTAHLKLVTTWERGYEGGGARGSRLENVAPMHRGMKQKIFPLRRERDEFQSRPVEIETWPIYE